MAEWQDSSPAGRRLGVQSPVTSTFAKKDRINEKQIKKIRNPLQELKYWLQIKSNVFLKSILKTSITVVCLLKKYPPECEFTIRNFLKTFMTPESYYLQNRENTIGVRRKSCLVSYSKRSYI